MTKKVAVIGGGAAGLMASYQAAVRGASVYLFERNPNLGRKILISGKGRCNLTNLKRLDEFIEYFPGNGKIPALYGENGDYCHGRATEGFAARRGSLGRQGG